MAQVQQKERAGQSAQANDILMEALRLVGFEFYMCSDSGCVRFVRACVEEEDHYPYSCHKYDIEVERYGIVTSRLEQQARNLPFELLAKLRKYIEALEDFKQGKITLVNVLRAKQEYESIKKRILREDRHARKLLKELGIIDYDEEEKDEVDECLRKIISRYAVTSCEDCDFAPP